MNFLLQKKPFFLFLLLGLGFCAPLQAQNNTTADSVSVSAPKKTTKKPKDPIPFQFKGLRVGTNVFSLILAARDFNQFRPELNAELNVSNRYFLTFDAGYSDMRSQKLGTNSFLYQNQGIFLRAGIDYNLMVRTFDDEALFLGVRYGISNFSQRLNYNVDGQYWDFEAIDNPDRDRYPVSLSEDNLSLSWAEIVGGFKVNLGQQGFWKNIYMQPTFMLQFRLTDPAYRLIKPTDIPGFGRNFSRTHLAFAYRMVWQFGK
ncbi:DUF6048 family protein [Hugenholtzia roseola]|uniref:DUF6048 family protein n=1 Tax=Hugenholtzia roseola TaxID=1002 RepID=UPI000478EABB|nr:DUF6048 family protein [Hugenholtzia roseola]